MIKKLLIRNYRRFESLDIDFEKGVNVLVGNNDTGKSTLIEAVTLALTGKVNGRQLSQELSPYLINLDATQKYVAALKVDEQALPPKMIIEVYLDESEATDILMGGNNLLKENACGIRIQATLNNEYIDEYKNFVTKPDSVRLAPTEYYKVDWLGFSGSSVTARSVPAAVAVIDPSTIHLQSGVDHHLLQIIRGHLEPKERVELSREYRSLREEFDQKRSVKDINERVKKESVDLTERNFSLSIDISQRFTWESNLVAHLDGLPFQFIGKGDQNSVKTLLAVGRRADDAHVVLIEEPETHLSFSSLRRLLPRIVKQCEDKQIIIATHSGYVLNKLGLEGMILLGSNGGHIRLADLPTDTVSYFKKLPGYDTLRLVLAEKAVLVEGPSDELVVQRAYRDIHGKEPIEDGIDVISVGTSHKRFLDIAKQLKKRVWIVRDNDGMSITDLEDRFSEYLAPNLVTLHSGNDPGIRTLEPQLVAANELSVLNSVLGKSYSTEAEAVEGMTKSKTESALAIYESPEKIVMPEYIADVCR